MYDWILLNNGSAQVVKIGDGVYALVPLDGVHCNFSFDPNTFYKFGYFMEPDELAPEAVGRVLDTLNKDIEQLNKENEWKQCVEVTIDEIRSAWKKFKDQPDIKELIIV